MNKIFCSRTLAAVVLIPSGLLLIACPELPWPPASVSSVSAFVLIVDPTAPGVSEMSVERLVRGVVPRAVALGVPVELWVVDARLGARRVQLFTPTAPVSSARKVVALHAKEMLRDAEALFRAAIIGSVFKDPPNSSPLVAALLTATAGRAGPIEVYFQTDCRESSAAVWNFEGRNGLPSPAQWAARLERIGYAKGTTLKGVALHIVGMPLVVPSDIEVIPARGLRIRKLFESLTQFGAEKVIFEDELPNWVMVFGVPFALRVKRYRAGRMAKKDFKTGANFDPLGAVTFLVGDKPLPEFNDPEIPQADREMRERGEEMGKLKEELHEVELMLAKLPWWVPLAGGVPILGTADAWGLSELLGKIGQDAPEKYVLGGLGAAFMIGICYKAAEGAGRDGKKPWWYWASIAGFSTLALGITAQRQFLSPAAGQSLAEDLAGSIIQAASVVGSPILIEILMGKLRIVMPFVKTSWLLRRKLRAARKAFKKAFDLLVDKARRRAWWEHCSKILQAAYARGYTQAGGRIPPRQMPPPPLGGSPPLPEDGDGGGSPRVPSQQANGLPSWPTQ